MTAEEFRSLALRFPEASEEAHMGHPDFRVRGKIFGLRQWGIGGGLARAIGPQTNKACPVAVFRGRGPAVPQAS